MSWLNATFPDEFEFIREQKDETKTIIVAINPIAPGSYARHQSCLEK